MSTNDVLRSKKQFKSQSVNSLFRQQTNGSDNPENKASSGPLSIKKKANGSATKLKLVSKKLNTVNRSKLEKKKSESPKESSPAAAWSSRSSSPELTNNQIATNGKSVNQVNVDDNTKKENVRPNDSTSTAQDIQGTREPLEQSYSTETPVTKPTISQLDPSNTIQHKVKYQEAPNINWAEEDEKEDDNIWLDLQNQIHNETRNTTNQESSWASTNTKLASFRKSSQTPTGFQSLTQSPLISNTNNSTNNDLYNESPIDFLTLNNTRQHSSESILFNNQTNNNNINQTPVSVPQNGPLSSPNVSDNNPWSTNFNLWGNDERQLSTKSDSFLWSPFNQNKSTTIDKNDDPLKRIGLESQTRSTSRFFPSPSVKQEQSFPILPTRSASDKFIEFSNDKQIDESINDIIKMIEPKAQYPDYLKTSTYKPESELFPGDFQLNDPYRSSPMSIPVSFPGSGSNNNGNTITNDHNTTQQEFKKPYFTTNDQYYPEGFASTFYKRGINNFMFVRELQPKLITSKAKDTVEVRVSLPSIKTNIQAEEDVFFKMRCYIINVSLRELNGKNNNGYKLSQKSNWYMSNNSNNNNSGNINNSKPRFGSANFKRGHSNGFYRKNQ